MNRNTPQPVRVRMFLVMAAAILLLASPSRAYSPDGPILIISSYNPETERTAATISEFMTQFKAMRGERRFVIENMNCKSFSEVKEWGGRMRGILDKYRGQNSPSLIFILGQEGWSAYISQPEERLDRSVPVICGRVSRNAIILPGPDADMRLWEPQSVDVMDDLNNTNIVSGFLYEYNIDRNISLARQLYPRTRNVALVTDNSYGGVSLRALVEKVVGEYPDLNLIPLDGSKYPLASIVKQIENLPENTVMMLGTWRVDSSDAYFLNNTLSDITAANPSLPCFSLTSIGMDNGALGGYVPQYGQQGSGNDLARQAVQWMDSSGSMSGNRQMQYVPNRYLFDFAQMTRLGLRERDLPSPHEIINREDSFVERYRTPLIAIGALFLMLLLGYLVVFYYFFRIKKLKDALEESEADNILILNNLRAEIKFITPDYRIKWFNNSTDGGIHRNTQGDSTAQYCYERDYGVDHVCEHCPVGRAVATGISAESTVELPRNEFINIVASPVYDNEGRLVGTVVRSEDVSKDKERERELLAAKEKAEESDRLKSAFLANMSHEIRTPLNAIVGFSTVLIADGVEDEERREYARIIQTNSDLLLRLINDILDISRLETGKLTFNYAPCEVVSLCNSVISTTRHTGTGEMEYVLDTEFESFDLLTDVQRLQQVLINLMSNAGKFTRKGSITLGVHMDRSSDCMVFSVTDTGVGIPPEKRKLVFERFEKLNEYVQGTGLGLSICKITVNLFGGEIWVDENYAAGARFVFTHPLHPPKSAVHAGS